MMHGLYYLFAIVGFALFDVWGFGYMVYNKKMNLVLYRILQGALEIGLDAFFVWRGLWMVGLGFELCHFGMGCDLLYYIIRGEDYRGYNITWFVSSIPAIIFRAEKVSFQGKYLTWIGEAAVVIGIAVSLI